MIILKPQSIPKFSLLQMIQTIPRTSYNILIAWPVLKFYLFCPGYLQVYENANTHNMAWTPLSDQHMNSYLSIALTQGPIQTCPLPWFPLWPWFTMQRMREGSSRCGLHTPFNTFLVTYCCLSQCARQCSTVCHASKNAKSRIDNAIN